MIKGPDPHGAGGSPSLRVQRQLVREPCFVLDRGHLELGRGPHARQGGAEPPVPWLGPSWSVSLEVSQRRPSGPRGFEKRGDPPERAGDSGADGLEEGVSSHSVLCSGQSVPERRLLSACFLLSAHFLWQKIGKWVRLWLPLQWHQRPLTPLPCCKTAPDDTTRTPPALPYAFRQIHTRSPGAVSWWALHGVRFAWSVSNLGLAPPLPHGCGRRR